MSDRDEINRFPLGHLDDGERYVGCLHFRQGTTFTQAARMLHEIAALAVQRFGATVETDDAEVCREYNYAACATIYEHPVIAAQAIGCDADFDIESSAAADYRA